jgi:hypothetical protein
MSRAAELHRRAMDLADRAMMEAIRGHSKAALSLYQDALPLERDAAFAAREERLGEPTTSVLLRSAATLALDAQNPREAERLVATALAGEPPDQIADELRDLLEQIHFRRHLALNGVRLNTAEFQFAMNGPAVGYGIVRSDEYVERVTTVENVLYRTAERQLGKPYRDRGAKSKALKEEVGVYVTVPRAASFAVTFKLGVDTQLPLFGEQTLADQVIEEVMTCFEMLERRDDEGIRKRIPDPAYLNNFIGLAQKIAPDGKNVTGVGFTSAGADGSPREVGLRRPRGDIRLRPQTVTPVPVVDVAASSAPPTTKVTGHLRFANELESQHEIRLVPDSGPVIRVVVPAGLMSDIVKPLWGERVTIEGTMRGDTLHMTNINRAE